MKKDTKNLISITEAGQDFSRVVKAVEQNGNVIVVKNNKPKYIISKIEEDKGVTDENTMALIVANLILTEHAKAFKELGK